MVDLTKISIDGKTASVNRDYAGNFQGLLNDLHSEGYQVESVGGYNYRNIAGTGRLSKHAFGNAIDVNPANNPVAWTSKEAMQTDIPNASSLAEKWGLKWGGNFKGLKKDPMHFEVTDATPKIGIDGVQNASFANPAADTGNGEFLGYKGGSNSDLYQGDKSGVKSGEGPLSMASPSTDPRWKAADANGDGSVSVSELKAYNASDAASKAAGSADAGDMGSASSIPRAIVTAANQQSEALASAAETAAKTATANTEATNSANTGIWQGLQTWLGGRLLQIMVFVLAAIFVLIGLYMFAPRGGSELPAGIVPGTS